MHDSDTSSAHSESAYSDQTAPSTAFDHFVRHEGERVRRALVAFYGVEVGTEATAEAMVVAWQRWDEVREMGNPTGFLFRVGQSKARPHVRWSRRRAGFPSTDLVEMSFDSSVVDLFAALAKVRADHRAAVLLVRAYGFSYREAAAVLGISEDTLNNHVRKGMSRLRWLLKTE
jgi:DNA-directed RNA polymerase specialized sigma24 family protein